MTGRGYKTKARKPLDTTLGQAPKDNERAPDVSHLRKPITTSVSGVKQVLELFQTATAEVQGYINYECDVLYECRSCRTIFRSIANFILHKRSYCREKFNHYKPEQGGFVVGTVVDEEKSDELDNNHKKSDKKAILPIVDKLVKRQEINLLAKNTLTEDFSSKIADKSDDDVVFVSEEKKTDVVLQTIDTSRAAVFQTAVKNPTGGDNCRRLMKSEVMEIHGILENNEAVLGSNGKVCNYETGRKIAKPNIPKQDLTCTECNFTFSTEKTLTHHIKYKHNKTCIVYPCPDCKETFANAWSVYRHLYKVHRRTSSQVRRMRAQIHSSGIRKDEEPEKKKRDKSGDSDDKKESEENQWMNNFEGDKDLQMCGGCGKRFERKAALHSHSQMCTKRIAICNTIKENDLKNRRADVESKSKDKAEKVEESRGLKGAAKRKPNLVFIHRVPSGGSQSSKQRLEEERVTEIISDSEEEKDSAISAVKVSHPEITITKTKPDERIEPDKAKPILEMEVEIFTISDDSDVEDKRITEKAKSLSGDTPPKARKRKRAVSLDLDRDSEKIAEEYKEFMNDEIDRCFFAKATPYIDKTQLKCIPCKTTYLSRYQLLWHMSLHFSWFRFQCSKCPFQSFNQYECTTHAYNNHGTPDHLMGSTVLPIPKWKVLMSSHKFTELTEEMINNNMSKALPVKEEGAAAAETDGSRRDDAQIFDDDEANGKMPTLEPIPEVDEKSGTDVSEREVPSSETIILDDDEMPDICNNANAQSDPLCVSDEDSSKDNSPVKDGGKVNGNKAGPSSARESLAVNRPVRNRIQSVKTLQNDFIYDLGKVLKVSDNKGGKLRRNLSK